MTPLNSAPKSLEDAAKSYAMGKTAIMPVTVMKGADLSKSSSSPASVSAAAVPNSYELWQAQQGRDSIAQLNITV